MASNFRARRIGRGLLVAAFALAGARILVLGAVTPQPPKVQAASGHVQQDAGVRRWNASWARRNAGILQAHLQGTPDAIGSAHARLFREEMIANERALWGVFEQFVPSRPLRGLVMDVARLRFSGLEDEIGYARRLEIASAARAFAPDPFETRLPTYARFLMLNALYDVSLSFEHSPLIGCSSVLVARADGAPLLGRNFDFEAHAIFDRDKAVILFAETGKVPVLSVAWPGLAGVVTGMNAEGVGAVVHGARAGEPSTSGQPALLTLREALAHASSAEEAAAWIAERDPVVSHIVLVADARGAGFVVERVPGRPAHLRPVAAPAGLTNHLEGPSADDPANLRVRETTSTLARRARLDALLAGGRRLDERGVLAVLRDRRAADGSPLPPGDRRAIDADIATHGVVMNLRERRIWVSQGPHLGGAFVAFDLRRWLADPQAESVRRGWATLDDD